MNGSLTFLFFFLFDIFFQSIYLRILGTVLAVLQIYFFDCANCRWWRPHERHFWKKRKRNGRSFHSKELISRLHGAARQTLKYLSFLYKWFLSIVGPRWHFSWRCGHWFSLRIFADVRVHRNSGGPFSLPSTCSACLIPFWFCSPFFFLFQTVIVCTVYIISP